MKKILLTSLALMSFVSVAHATEISPYVSLKGVYTKTTASNFKYAGITTSGDPDNSKTTFSDSTYGARLAFGAKIDFLRTELELGWNKDFSKTYSEGDGYKASFKTKTALLNAYYDIFTKGGLTPYVGAGIGLSHLNARVAEEKLSGNSFAWQVGAGVAYNLTNNLALDIGYRYMDYGNVSKNTSDEYGTGKLKAKLKTNEVLAGLRYTF